MSDIIKIVEKGGQGTMWSVLDMLEEAVKEMKEYPELYNKAIVIFLNDASGDYTTNYIQAGLNRPQIISLLEIMKARFINGLLGFQESGA